MTRFLKVTAVILALVAMVIIIGVAGAGDDRPLNASDFRLFLAACLLLMLSRAVKALADLSLNRGVQRV